MRETVVPVLSTWVGFVFVMSSVPLYLLRPSRGVYSGSPWFLLGPKRSMSRGQGRRCGDNKKTNGSPTTNGPEQIAVRPLRRFGSRSLDSLHVSRKVSP